MVPVHARLPSCKAWCSKGRLRIQIWPTTANPVLHVPRCSGMKQTWTATSSLGGLCSFKTLYKPHNETYTSNSSQVQRASWLTLSVIPRANQSTKHGQWRTRGVIVDFDANNAVYQKLRVRTMDGIRIRICAVGHSPRQNPAIYPAFHLGPSARSPQVL